MKSSFLTKYKSVLFPAAVTVILVVLGLAVGNFLLGRIGAIRSEIRSVETDKLILEDRLATLQNVDTELTSNVNLISVAIPEKNPSVLITRQLRTLATKWSIGLANLSITTPSLPEGVEATGNTHEVNFEASGNYQSLFGFIDELSKIVPLVNLSSMTLRTPVSGNITAQVNLIAQSAPYPKELPALTEALVGLTESEQETLQVIETFTPPQIDGVPVSTSSGDTITRPDPFAPL